MNHSEKSSFFYSLSLSIFVILVETILNSRDGPMRFGIGVHGVAFSALLCFVFSISIISRFQCKAKIFHIFLFTNCLYYILSDLYLGFMGDFPTLRMLYMIRTAIQFIDAIFIFWTYKHVIVMVFAIVIGLATTKLVEAKG